uniref:Probable methylmalonate-semialdehyde/malonate-semialdehyde dehydrogenase [acylating], mitochondrial n=1 Tax=Plutella xylostella TaxID=51655 RepID=A0A1L8D6N8_PLUXY
MHIHSLYRLNPTCPLHPTPPQSNLPPTPTGEAKEWIPDLVARAKALKVNAGHVPGTDVGPVISVQAKDRINRLVESGESRDI